KGSVQYDEQIYVAANAWLTIGVGTEEDNLLRPKAIHNLGYNLIDRRSWCTPSDILLQLASRTNGFFHVDHPNRLYDSAVKQYSIKLAVYVATWQALRLWAAPPISCILILISLETGSSLMLHTLWKPSSLSESRPP